MGNYKGGYVILDLGEVLVNGTITITDSIQFSSNYTGKQLKEKIKEIIANKKPILLKCIINDLEHIKFVEYHKFQDLNFEIVIVKDFDIDEENITISAYYKTDLYYNIENDTLIYHEYTIE